MLLLPYVAPQPCSQIPQREILVASDMWYGESNDEYPDMFTIAYTDLI
jgi:hypothetical protein